MLLPQFFPRSQSAPIVRLLSALFSAFLFTSCASLTSISALTPQSKDQRVTVQGKVVTIAPMMNQSAYEVQDPQGNSIWVLTSRTPPQLQSDVSATGTVKFESIVVEGQEIGQVYVEE